MSWFTPQGAEWRYVSTRLIPARRIALWLALAPPLLGLTALGVAVGGAAWSATVLVVLFGLWCSWIISRQVSAHAWAEREEDLLVKRGRLFRRITVVPYGRMQYVEVAAGPLARAFGIARVQLQTASPGSDAHISGVPAEEAARLRDRLTERGEAKLAGL